MSSAPTSYICDGCNQIFKSTNSLLGHKARCRLKCRFCSRNFKNKFGLRGHLKVHKVKPFTSGNASEQIAQNDDKSTSIPHYSNDIHLSPITQSTSEEISETSASEMQPFTTSNVNALEQIAQKEDSSSIISDYLNGIPSTAIKQYPYGENISSAAVYEDSDREFSDDLLERNRILTNKRSKMKRIYNIDSDESFTSNIFKRMKRIQNSKCFMEIISQVASQS